MRRPHELHSRVDTSELCETSLVLWGRVVQCAQFRGRNRRQNILATGDFEDCLLQ